MNFSLYIAKRYLFTKSSNNAINIMTIIAASGVVVAAAALFIVLSGFAGLKDFSLEFSSFVDPDLKILPAQGKSFLLSDKDSTALAKMDGIAYYSKIIEERIIMEFDNKNLLASLKGVDEHYLKVTSIDSMIIQGQWFEKGSGQLVSGWGIAHKLSFGVLDYGKALNIYVPKPGVGQITSIKGAFNSLNMVNIGVFYVNEDLNGTYVYTDIVNARYLMDYAKNQVTSIEIKLQPNADEKTVRKAILESFDTDVIVKNRAQLNDSLYKMLNTENMVVYLIFTLVIIIALFNVIGALIMMVLDKKGSLNTLYNIGATTKDIRRVFFLQGSLMTILGGLAGVLIGFIVVVLQQQFALVMITPSLPYPVKIQVVNVLVVLVTIAVLGLIASKIASARINEKLMQN
ncbi:ABC transporter permease [Gelidibacter gilvus]|uniref:FtsX-like permease family protein n=1 Tax=Gelidibacter gilvus TaxID=59602 RepID=A0A4Q0XJP0_9FLAO|nr:FtsX-like permease family protein [Gelidibacter gilvus]RXJ52399.1 FtsX-like permease family protein [Gelidibacter gilvus]